MLRRGYRFHGHSSLNYVYKHGVNTRGELFSVRSVLNTRRETYRCAVVVSKKVSKSAVVRNRIRRRLFELLQVALATQTEPHDIVLTVFRPEVASIDTDRLAKQLHQVLTRAGLVAKSKSIKRATIDTKEN